MGGPLLIFLRTTMLSLKTQKALVIVGLLFFWYSQGTAVAQTTTMCPDTFVELSRNDSDVMCEYSAVLTTSFQGRPSQSSEGRSLITDAAIVCRATPRATFVNGGDRGATGVFVTCRVGLSPEEIAAIEEQRRLEEEERRRQEEEEERRRQEEEERQREEEERQQEEEERQREEEERQQEEEERQREEEERQREEEERQRQEQVRLEREEQEARDAPLVFDTVEVIQADPVDESVATGLVSACEGLRKQPNRTAAQNDLLERCIDINREGSVSNKSAAVGQVAAKQYADIGQSLNFLNTIQVGNIGGRLAAILPTLRQNARDVATVDSNHPSKGLLANNDYFKRQVGGAAGDTQASGRFGVFVAGSSGEGEKDRTLLSRGFNYDSSSMTLGLDYMLNATTVIGMAYGYGRTESDFTGATGSMDIQTDTLTAYAAKAFKNQWGLDLLVGVGDVEIENVRNMNFIAHGNTVDQTALSQINSDQLIVSAGVSKGFDSFVNLDVSARFNFIRTNSERFSEQIDSSAPGFGLALEIDATETESLTSDISLSFSKAFSTGWGGVIPQAKVSWVHEFESGSRFMTGRFLADTSTLDFKQSGIELGAAGSGLFRVPLEQLDTDYGNLSLGLNLLFPNQITLNMSVNQTLGISDFDHTYWSLNARKDF